MAKKNSPDVYQIVTDRVIAEMEKGEIPWRKPWIRPTVKNSTIRIAVDPTQAAYSRSTGKAYSLLNQMLLRLPGEWATYKQIAEAGGQVKKGEKSSICVFWKFLDVKTGMKNADGEDITEQIPMLRYYNVFHVETQCEGITPKARKAWDEEIVGSIETVSTWDPVAEAEKLVSAYLGREKIDHHSRLGGDRAYYSPALDYIETPAMAQFRSAEDYYGTLLHEMVHSTGHESRLNRFGDAGQMRFGSEVYSKEELVAEIGSATLLHILGIETDGGIRNTAAYIQSWLKVLKDDPKFIVSAAGKAEKAVNLILA